jgi:hypothetical protein
LSDTLKELQPVLDNYFLACVLNRCLGSFNSALGIGQLTEMAATSAMLFIIEEGC